MTDLRRPTPWPSQEWEPKGEMSRDARVLVLRLLDAAECVEDDGGKRVCVMDGDELERAMKILLGNTS